MTRGAAFHRRLTGLGLWLILACEAPASRALEEGNAKLREGMASFASPQGIAALRDAAMLFERAGSAAKHAEALYWTALAEQEAKNFTSALTAIEQALATHVGGEGFYDEFGAHLLIGELQTELGNHAAAAAAIQRARAKAIRSNSRWNEWRSLEALANLHARRRQPEEARKAWAEAHSIAVGSNLWALGEVSRGWGDFEAAQGNADAARQRYDEAAQAHREALAQLDREPGAPNRRMHIERSQLGAAESLLGAARLEAARGNAAASAQLCADGLALLADTATTAETSPDALQWRAARPRREVLEELRKLAAKLRQERTTSEPEPIDPSMREAIHVRGDGKVALSRSLVERLRKEPQLLTRSARWIPEIAQDRVVALRLFGVRENTIWGALGFRNGDRLTTINGHPATTLADSEPALEQLRTASSVKVTFDRHRKPHELLFVLE